MGHGAILLTMLYKVRIGEDVYVGTPAEVVAFMMRAEGAGGHDAASYMEATAARVGERLGVDGIRTDDEEAFLDSLQAQGVIPVEMFEEPQRHRTDPKEALGDGPIAYGPGVDPKDVDL